jgi:hypothetical protein
MYADAGLKVIGVEMTGNVISFTIKPPLLIRKVSV